MELCSTLHNNLKILSEECETFDIKSGASMT